MTSGASSSHSVGHTQHWRLADRYDRGGARLADRHYSRQTHGSPQFVPPGKLLVLRAEGAVWATVMQKHVKHAWPGAWNCTIFRNENRALLSSGLVREACAITRWKFGDTAPGMITFVDPAKVRHKRDPGRCFLRAGFRHIATIIKSRLHVLWLALEDFPAALAPIGAQTEAFAS